MTQNSNKILNLKWVSDVIGDKYKSWGVGETILLQAQTGTGKTKFIIHTLVPYLAKRSEDVLYLCNRVKLKNQVKISLLNLFDIPIPEDEELDKLCKIQNVTVMSYQTMQELLLNQQYNGEKFEISKFNTIVADEIHYVFADTFNCKTRLAVDELIKDYKPFTTMIFISATMDELTEIIENANKKHFKGSTLVCYKTGEDYSYVNPIAFHANPKKNIIRNLIINDKSEAKWMIFVTKKSDGEDLKEEFLNNGVSAEFIAAGTQNQEVTNIVKNSKFSTKVLICTKVLDNGVNIDDKLLKNIVIYELDYVTFKQSLGRIRINIKDATVINLYIPKHYKKTLLQKINFQIKPKLDAIDLFNDDYNAFERKYDNALNTIFSDIFYKYKGEYVINLIGEAKLHEDKLAFQNIIDKYEWLEEETFVIEVLSWLGLSKIEYESIDETPVLISKIDTLEAYLDSVVGEVMLQAKDRKELIDKIGLIDSHNSNVEIGKIKLLKNIDTLNGYLNEIETNFTIKQFETSRIDDNNKKNYKSAWKVMRLSDV